MTNGEALLMKILQLLPAVGSPKLVGNIGSQRQVTAINTNVAGPSFDLVNCSLSDPRKPANIAVTIEDRTPYPGAGVNVVLIEYKLFFGTGDVKIETPWFVATRGVKISVQGTFVNLLCRMTFTAGPTSPTSIVAGFASIESGPTVFAPVYTRDMLSNVAPLDLTQFVVIPSFAKAVLVCAWNTGPGFRVVNGEPFDVELRNTAGLVGFHQYTSTEKTGWIPVSNAEYLRLVNTGVANSNYVFMFALEF